jgi:hypothetical protein
MTLVDSWGKGQPEMKLEVAIELIQAPDAADKNTRVAEGEEQPEEA